MSFARNTEDENWSYRAYREACKKCRKMYGYNDSDVITFRDFFSFPKTRDSWEDQIQYWVGRLMESPPWPTSLPGRGSD